MEKVNHSVWRIGELIDLIYSDKLLIDKCEMWGKERCLKLVLQLGNYENIGVFHIHELKDSKYHLVDGVRRIGAILNVLCGNGFYFDLEKNEFTLEEKYSHGKLVQNLEGIICSDYRNLGVTLKQVGMIQEAVSNILDKRVFVCSYGSQTSLNEIYRAINNGNLLGNDKIEVINGQTLQLENVVIPFCEKK